MTSDYLITTRQNLVDSIHQAVEECFSDELSGPAPPRIIVFRLVGEILARVLDNQPRFKVDDGISDPDDLRGAGDKPQAFPELVAV